MKKIMKFWIIAIIGLCFQSHETFAQLIDEERMNRDLEVAENVLATLIKQEMGQQKTLFGMDVKASYQPGYGVTFRLPSDNAMPFVINLGGDDFHGATVISDGNGFQYSIRTNGYGTPAPGKIEFKSDEDEAKAIEDEIKIVEGDVKKVEGDIKKIKAKPYKLKEKKEMIVDSVQEVYFDRLIQAAQNFILNYGDFLISQLAPNERIVVTNQHDRPNFYFRSGKRTRISVEGTKADITALKQGKLTRDQALKKITVVNTESVDTREPDMEMISSIFTRLYRPDLSKTYFVQGNVYYERLKDYGAIFYMQMLSSEEKSPDSFTLPTIGLADLDQKARDKKVTELYSAFEQDVKENILEYGRTVKSLKDDEILVFNISLTKCKGCGIPSTLEVSIKSSVLKDFGSAKIDRNAALSKFVLKKGAKQ
ncbi:MAG: hypothetical protein WD824_23520 [Cyclobacteriaceae bacterium]